MKPWFPPGSASRIAAPTALDPRPELDREVSSARTCLFAAILLAIMVAALLPRLVGMRVDAASFFPPLELIPSVAILWTWASWRGRPRARAAAELALTPLLLSLPVVVFSYSAMHVVFPLQDTRLEAWDSMLGFHALEFIAWIDRHPALAEFLRMSYNSFFPQIIVLPVLLVMTGRLERAYAMTLAVLLLGAIGSPICMFFPAVGIYVHHGIPFGSYEHVDQSLGYFHVQLEAVRHDPSFVLDLSKTAGIVAFPSGHAAIAVLCAWAAWAVRWARWPFLVVNAGMFVSAIPQGAHYLVDLIAGAGVAIVSVVIATRLPRVVPFERLRGPLLAGLKPVITPR